MPSQPSSRVLPGRPGGAAGTPSAHCACAAMLPSRARAFPSPASRGAGRWGKHRAQRACVNTRQTPARGPGNPHPPQCALGAGRGNRLKPEWCLLLRWRGREREQGLPKVPAPAFAVAVATPRAVRSAGATAAWGSRAALRLRGAPLLWPGFPLERLEIGWGGEERVGYPGGEERGGRGCRGGVGAGEGGGTRRVGMMGRGVPKEEGRGRA